MTPAGSRKAKRQSPLEPAPGTDAHTHLRISFVDGGPDVCFRDVRKFGKVKLVAQGQSEPRLKRLGHDALQTTGEHLFAKTRKRKTAVKTLLLNQAIVAGVGNIYADEALFISGVRPTRKAFKLSQSECETLAKAIRTVLGRAIDAGGSTIRDFMAPDGRSGSYQAKRLVYARGGEACKRCKSIIARIVLGGRSTHYCPSCQL
jgi:formamidopyrimidine-DNA glycosylase